MRRSRTAQERKSSRRRSWFHGSNIFTMFSSQLPSPEQTSLDSDLTNKQRSQSLTPVDTTSSTPTSSIMSRSSLFQNKRSTISNMLSKASQKKNYRKESQDSQSSVYEDNTLSILRRSSDATTVSDTLPQVPKQYRHQQLLKTDEEEADRIQLKNDLVKLAFEG